LASLNHPNIATIYELLQEAEGISYLVLEYIPGQTLVERIASARLKPQEALSIAHQIADAVAAAHELGIIHRDLKPGNIKITPEGRIKVLDFGLAKVLSSETVDQQNTVTIPGRIMGTPAYMCPEQARGLEADERCDIWSFGCVLYEMLTGKVPFEGETVSDTLAGILNREPDWQALPKSTPANIQVLLRRCLEKDSRRRRPEHRIKNSFQTNATKLTAAWARFFRANRIGVGISIDGPAHLHNSQRSYRSGKGSYEDVLRGLSLLKEYEVQFSGLVVVDEATLKLGAHRLLDFLVGQGIFNFGFLAAKPKNQPAAEAGTTVEHYIEPARMNVFLKDLYDAWLNRGDRNVKIRELENLKAKIRNGVTESCTLSGKCWGHYYMIEPDGDVVVCDVFSGDSRYTLGNIMNNSFTQIAKNTKLLQLKNEHRDAMEAMSGCPEFDVCKGWCPHERYVSIRHNKRHRDDCCGLRDLITYIRNRMAEEIKMS